MSTLIYCPRCGDATFVLKDKSYGCSRCGYTYYHNTAVGVAVVINCGPRVAWITRATEPGAGLLDLPGGFVDGGESLESAVIREAREEIGVELAEPRYLFSIPNSYSYHTIEYRTVDAFFNCVIKVPPVFVPNAEAASLHWLALDEVEAAAIAFESVRKALERLRRVGF